ncbi:DUF1173 family protein [Caldisericum sp.]|uniref:DUF1173 family protein n=1 Tax=Caldisericum sp. TaxID=2499687 RepID=UPI003D0AD8EC
MKNSDSEKDEKGFFKVYPIAIVTPKGLKKYSTEFQTQKFEDFQKVLAKWYKKTHAICLCPGKGKKKLAIKYYEPTGIYYLSRYPKSGNDHSEDCIYRYSPEVITESEDIKETMSLRLSKTVSPRRKKKIKKISEKDIINKKESQLQEHLKVKRESPRVSLIDFFNIVWSTAGLNSWSPKKDNFINYNYILQRIRAVSKNIKVGGQKLLHVLSTSVLNGDKELANINEKTLNIVYTKKARTVFFGFLRKYKEGITKLPDDDKKDWEVPILDYSKKIKIVLHKDLVKKVKKKFKDKLELWQKGYLTFCVCLADVEKEKESNVFILRPVDLALVNLSEKFIPIDSEEEAQLEKNLRKEKKAFKKVLISKEERKGLSKFVLFDKKIQKKKEV